MGKRGRGPSPHCSKCGVVKTVENSNTRDGGARFMGTCRRCATKTVVAKYRAELPTENLWRLLSKYEEAIVEIRGELNKRENQDG